jgi:hypothetical protein
MAESTEPKKLTVEDLVKSQNRLEKLMLQLSEKDSFSVDSLAATAWQMAGMLGLFGCSVASAVYGPVPILCYIAFCAYIISVMMVRFPRASAADQSAMREASANQARTKSETSASRASAMNWR